MKILKKGNYFRAYATIMNEENTRFSVGDEMGSISIITGKFVGATCCMVQLHEHLDLYNKTEKS